MPASCQSQSCAKCMKGVCAHLGITGVILGLYWENGEENGNYLHGIYKNRSLVRFEFEVKSSPSLQFRCPRRELQSLGFPGFSTFSCRGQRGEVPSHKVDRIRLRF